MRLIPIGLVSLLLSACPGDPDDRSFKPVEPTAGTTFDRCNIRVRSTSPSGDDNWGYGGTGLETKQHVNWRIDGGRETEVRPMSGNTPERANYMFGVQLAEGAQTLELGNCDEFDICEWQSLSLSVANAIGAPDCRSAGGGQQIFEYRRTGGATALADGRIALIVTVDGGVGGILMLKPDGSIDTTFGVQGLAEVPLFATAIAPHPDGGFLVLGDKFYLARVSAAGVLDRSFGTAAGTQGARFIPCGVGQGCKGLSLRDDGQGGFWFAAATGLTAGSTQLTPILIRLDGTAAVASHTVLDTGVTDTEYGYTTAAIDATGRTVIVAKTFAVVGSSTGVDTTFATNGRLDYPNVDLSAAGAAIAGPRVVVARTVVTGTALELEVRMFDSTGPRPITKLPLNTASNPTVGGIGAQIAADGKLYVSTARTRAAESLAYAPVGPGTEMMIARFVDGVLDPAFGTQGISAMSFRDVWSPVSSETLLDLPIHMVLGSDGAPWVFGISSTSAQTTEPALLRGPCVTAAKIRI